LELVLHLLRRPPAVPHLLVFAARPGGAAARLSDGARGTGDDGRPSDGAGAATRLLDAARHAPGFAALSLEPLGAELALGLRGGVRDPAVRRRVARDAGGNPLFLRELARAAGRPGRDLPPTLAAAIGGELAALPPDARTLLDGAAVAGDPFDAELA